MDELQFTEDYYGGRMAYPADAPHELILGKKGTTTVALWNGAIVNAPDDVPMNRSDGSDLWVHVDRSIALSEVLPWMTAALAQRYALYFSTLESNENDEQIHLTGWDIAGTRQEGSKVINEYCKDCELHLNEPILIVAELEYIGPELLVFRGDTNDAFQTRNAIERFLGSSRKSRLNARIDLHITGTVPFYEYQQVIEEVRYAQYAAATILYYRNSDDPDQPRILELQENHAGHEVMLEFPLRLREIVHPAVPKEGKEMRAR